jgi:hypothetical protein
MGRFMGTSGDVVAALMVEDGFRDLRDLSRELARDRSGIGRKILPGRFQR